MIYGDHTFYVLGAYAVAAVLIGGLCVVSILRYRWLRKKMYRDRK